MCKGTGEGSRGRWAELADNSADLPPVKGRRVGLEEVATESSFKKKVQPGYCEVLKPKSLMGRDVHFFWNAPA